METDITFVWDLNFVEQVSIYKKRIQFRNIFW